MTNWRKVSKPTHPMSFRVCDDVKAKVEKLAFEQQRSIAYTLMKLVEAGLEAIEAIEVNEVNEEEQSTVGGELIT